MLKVAILDDYQNVSQEFVDLKKLSGKYEFKIFSEPFLDEADAIEQLSDFEALLIMRERTPITKNLIDNLNDLKYIITSGSRNKAIDLEAAHKRKIIVCGTEINFNPTCELTWALILGLSKNLKTEIDNMYQGYWQTTVGFELKGKIIGLIGLGRVGSQVAKIANAFGMQVIAWSENLDLDKCKELECFTM
jgi:D-3-phosphoglycerate dehydrogenase